MDRFEGLTLFCRAVERGSLAGAARDLGMSAAAATRHLQALEERLGVRLINRTTRRLAMTEVGREFHLRARRILDDLMEAETSATSAQEAPRGEVRMTAPMTFGIDHLAPLLPSFLGRCPEVSIDLQLSDVVVDLIEQGFDLALRIRSTLPDSSLIARRLATMDVVIAASPDYLARYGTPIDPEAAAGHPGLVYTLSPHVGEWAMVDGAGRRATLRLTGRLRSNNAAPLVEAAAAGMGIVVMPRFILAASIATGRLVPILTDWQIPHQTLWAVTPAARLQAPKVRALVDFLADRFRTLEWEAPSAPHRPGAVLRAV